MAKIFTPLAPNVPIVDKDGNPTPYFQRIMQEISDARISASLIDALGGDPDEDAVVVWDDTAGDLAFVPNDELLALDDLTDVDTSGVSSGDVLTYDGADWVAGAVSGGGGWTPTEPVAADFSTVRTGTSITPGVITDLTDSPGVRCSFVRTVTGSDWRQTYILKTVSGGVPFRAECLISNPLQAINNWYMPRLSISTSNASDVARHLSSSVYHEGNQYNFPHSAHRNTGLNSAETAWTTIHQASTACLDTMIWMAIEWTGTDVIMYGSYDGYTWIKFATEPDSFFTGDPNLVGFGWESVGSDGGTHHIWCPHFHITTDLSEPKGLNRV